jgi:hypothetical protein
MSEANHTLAERGEREEVTQADVAEAEALLVRDWFSDDEREIAAKAFARVRIAARNAALEECAKIAESDRLVLGDTRRPGSFAGTRKDHGELIASVIRAEASQLSTQPHTNGES